MKRFYSTLLISAAAALLSSCIVDERIETGGKESAEVDIQISTSGRRGGTRAQLDGNDEDAGIAAERRISTLDVLIFNYRADGTGTYMYRCAAVPLPESEGEGVYRINLKNNSGTFDVHLFANCRAILDRYTDEAFKNKDWAAVHAMLVDDEPDRLVGKSSFVDLPMYCYLSEQTLVMDESSPTPTSWPNGGEPKPAMLRRSVASFDLFVQKNAATDRFVLEDLFVWNVPDRGAMGEIVLNADDHSALDYWYPYTTPRYLVPEGMATNRNAREAVAADAGADPPVAAVAARYHATKTDDDVTVSGDNAGTYQQIAYKMYVYDNPYRTTALGDTKRPTRLVMGGRYRTTEAVEGSGTPDNPEIPAQWKKAYYPIDIVEGAEDNYRPVIRNWKYEFKVVGVYGPGYSDLESAATGATINLNVGVTLWEKGDAQIGVRGKYYVTMAEKEVSLWRYAGDERTLPLSYTELDDGGGTFSLAFTKNQHFGNPGIVRAEDNGNVGEYTIRNAFFEVTVVQNGNTKTAEFTVTALQNYSTEENSTETVEVRFRDLLFNLDITQLSSADEDWIDGGDQHWTAGE